MAEVFHITHDANNWNEYDSGVPPGGSKVALSAAAALGGSTYGLAVDVTAAGISFIEKDLSGISNSATVIRFGFRMNLNGIALTASSAETLFQIIPGSGLEFCEAIWLVENGSGGFYIEVDSLDDDGSPRELDSAGTLPSGDITIEIVWDKPASTSSNDGVCTIYVNGVSSASITTLDNFDNFEDVTGEPSPDNNLVLDLGSSGGGSDSGTLYIDEFIIRDDDTQIYPVPGFDGYDLVLGGGQP
jgi:hypothetical protein